MAPRLPLELQYEVLLFASWTQHYTLSQVCTAWRIFLHKSDAAREKRYCPVESIPEPKNRCRSHRSLGQERHKLNAPGTPFLHRLFTSHQLYLLAREDPPRFKACSEGSKQILGGWLTLSESAEFDFTPWLEDPICINTEKVTIALPVPRRETPRKYDWKDAKINYSEEYMTCGISLLRIPSKFSKPGGKVPTVKEYLENIAKVVNRHLDLCYPPHVKERPPQWKMQVLIVTFGLEGVSLVVDVWEDR